MATIQWTGGATFTYDDAPTFTYTNLTPKRPGVGPWRYKRYRKRRPMTATMTDFVPPSIGDFTSTNTLTEAEVPRRSYWRRLWNALLGR